MTSFFTDIESAFLLQISHGNLESYVCGWPNGLNWVGVGSVEGVIGAVEYDRVTSGNFHIEYLPQTVKRIHITRCRQKFIDFDTRLLPRDTESIILTSNHFEGKFNLRELPMGLRELNMRLNFLRGPLSFTNLPTRMRILNLAHNRLRQDTIYYANLPNTLEYIDLFCVGRIKAVRPLCPDMKVRDKGVGAFLSISKSKVH